MTEEDEQSCWVEQIRLLHVLLSGLLLHIDRLAVSGLSIDGLSLHGLLRVHGLRRLRIHRLLAHGLTRLLHVDGLARRHLALHDSGGDHGLAVHHHLLVGRGTGHGSVADFEIDLRLEAGLDGAVRDVSHTANELSQFSELCTEDGENIADASEELQAVVATNQTTIARIALQTLGVHDIHAGGGHGARRAANHLTAKAAFGARLLAHLTGLDTAAVEVALATAVLGHVHVENTASQLEHGAARAQASDAET